MRGVISCASITPQRTELYADHISKWIRFLATRNRCHSRTCFKTKTRRIKNVRQGFPIPTIVGGCSYEAALHLMRTGAAGILVGVGSIMHDKRSPRTVAPSNGNRWCSCSQNTRLKTGVYVRHSQGMAEILLKQLCVARRRWWAYHLQQLQKHQ